MSLSNENFQLRFGFNHRGNKSTNIIELRNWIKDYCGQINIEVEFIPYTYDYYAVYFFGKNGFLWGSNNYATHDGGSNWYDYAFLKPTNIHFINENTGYTITGQEIWATIDGGVNWEVRSQGFGGNGIYFSDEYKGWLFSDKSVYFSNNGGFNWNLIESFNEVNKNLYKMFSLDSLNMWISGEGIVLITDNGWQTYKQSTNGLADKDYQDIYFVNKYNGWLWQSQSDYRYTMDGGNTWIRDDLLNDNYVNVIVGVHPNYVWATEWHGKLFKSSDAGISWKECSTGDWTPGLFFSDSLNGWASTSIGLYKTSDGGTTWDDQIAHLNDSATWKNILIKIPGQKYPQKELLLIAHYDSNEGQGADDNASGISTLLEILNIVSNYKFAYTLQIIFISGEEDGLRGSRYYAYTAKKNNTEILGVLNIDMVGYWIEGLARDLNIIYNPNSQELADNCLNAISHYTSTVAVKGFSFGPQSDHESFWNNGYPAVWFCEAGTRVEMSPYANLRQDVIETINFTFLSENIKAALAATASLAIPVTQK